MVIHAVARPPRSAPETRGAGLGALPRPSDMLRSGLVSTLIVLAAQAAGAQTTWYVDGAGVPPGTGTQSSPYTSVQYAIAQASTVSGDTLLVAAGTYAEHLDLLGKDLEIAGEGAGQTFIDGGGLDRVVNFSAGAGGELRDLTLQNGWALLPGNDRGGGVWIQGGSPVLRRVIVRNCVAQFGGGIAIDGGSPQILDSSIQFNGASTPPTTAGAGIWADCVSSPSIEDSDITFNQHTQFGGGVAGSGTYRRCAIDDNVAWRGGGANALGCALVLIDCSVKRNIAANTQGDLFEGGGAIGPADLVRCAIEDNLANYEGGGALDCTLIECVVRGNVLDNFATSTVVARGGGVARSTLDNCLLEDNLVGGGVGGFEFLRGDGAGAWDSTLVNCVLRGNLARNGNGGGAAQSSLTGCDLRGNEARVGMGAGTGRGGAAADSTLVRCIAIGNLANEGGGAAESTLDFCTVFANTAATGGGALFDVNGVESVANSVLWDNHPDQIADSSGLLEVRYCVVDGDWPGVANTAADPLFFAPIARDVHLKPGSPSIDAADPARPLDPDGSPADIGALAFDAGYCAAPKSYCTAKLNSQGCKPAISASGSASLSGPDSFMIHGSNIVENKMGFLFWSFQSLAAPFAGGVRCVGVAVRTPQQNSNGEPAPAVCSGQYSFAFTHAYAAQYSLGAGTTIHAQWFSRDPANPDGTGVSLSNGLEATLCP